MRTYIVNMFIVLVSMTCHTHLSQKDPFQDCPQINMIEILENAENYKINNHLFSWSINVGVLWHEWVIRGSVDREREKKSL